MKWNVLQSLCGRWDLCLFAPGGLVTFINRDHRSIFPQSHRILELDGFFFFTKCTFTFLKKNNTEKLTAYRKPGLYCINNKFCLYWSRHSRLWYYKRISTSCFIFIEIKTILRSKNINDYEALFKMFLSKTWRGLSPRYGGCGCRTD